MYKLIEDNILNENKIMNLLDENNLSSGFINDLLNCFMNSLLKEQNKGEYIFFTEKISEYCIVINIIDKSFYNFIKTLQTNTYINKQSDLYSMKISDETMNYQFIIEINSSYISFKNKKIDNLKLDIFNIICDVSSELNQVNILNNGFVYAIKKNGNSYPATLKFVSYCCQYYIFWKLFICYCNIKGKSFPIYKDLERDLIANPHGISCNLYINEAESCHSYQEWILKHYKTVTNVPKSVNKEEIGYSTCKALACKIVPENYQQQIYNLDLNKGIICSASKVLSIYYLKKLNVSGCESNIIYDYIKMSMYLKENINMRIKSFNKLKDAHNQIVNPYMRKKAKNNKNSKMTIPKNSIFRKLQLPDNFEIIKTGARLYEEGAIMHHCVYSYKDEVNKGQCVIAHLTYNNVAYTLEIKYRRKKYECIQMYGAWNSIAPTEVWEYVDSVLTKASKINKK